MRDRTRGWSARELLDAASLVLAVTVGLCVGLTWGHTDIDDGLSWFATLPRTVVPYTLGLVATSVLLLGAARRVPVVPAARPTRIVSLWTAVLLVGLAATPYTVGPGIEAAHRTIGSLLFAGQLLYAAWVVRERRDLVDAALWVTILLAGVACFLYFAIGLMGVMLAGQLVFQAALLVVLRRELLRLGDQVTTSP